MKWWPALLLVAGCSQADAPAPPRFDPVEFFTGRAESAGTIVPVIGHDTRFTTSLHGVAQNGEVLMTQHFSFDDGTSQDRVWHLRRIDPAHIEATANGVIGTAHGTISGDALRWRYVLETRPGWLHRVLMDQVIQSDGQGGADTRVTIRKLGLPVAHVREHFTRLPDPP